ncbi:zinc finger MYM-type protein 1-like [Ctenocephalides felis]|uniref:zinc finger MYM-type protein 1-like n=1 Tax=Ctenocephalides felis TaxID=7515 RepID=UPI000E6E259C|nr:zinc finger MYM-type protein 1-like [Ctenocephalides felis]
MATSVPAERFFSEAGTVMTEKRNRLKPDYLNKLLFLAGRSEKEWQLQNVWIEGFDDWKHIAEAIQRHEISKIHLHSCIAYQQWLLHGKLDEGHESAIKKEKSFWRQVLSRLLDVTLTLSTCNLAFRVHRENVDSSSKGNFLSIIELLAKYDPILHELVSKPKGQVKYLSPIIQNELIYVLTLKLQDAAINEINAAPFYSIIFDTTQDISKTDQLCKLYRYCMIEKDENGISKALVIKETFLRFHKLKDQTALGMSKKIIKSITDKNIHLNKYRWQGYDGANTMKGTYDGVQKLIKDVEPNAVYVHCAAHNLNLVLNNAVREIINIIKRWNILSSLISNSESETAVTLKILNPTRWAGRYDAVFALKVRFVEVQKALAKTILFNCKPDERNEAVSLEKKIENFNFEMLLVFHCKILQIIDAASKALQSKDADLSNALKRLKTCLEQWKKYRHDFENLKLEANSVAEKWSITPEFSKTRQKKVKRHFDDLCEDERLQDPESLFKVNIFYRVLDIIINQLKSRFYPMNELISNFSILQPSTLKALNDTEIMKKALEFVKVYKKDISESFAKEILSFRSTFRDEIEKSSCIKDLANLLLIKNHFMSCSFHEMCTALLLFLTIPVTTASAERSFLKLKLIKKTI